MTAYQGQGLEFDMKYHILYFSRTSTGCHIKLDLFDKALNNSLLFHC